MKIKNVINLAFFVILVMSIVFCCKKESTVQNVSKTFIKQKITGLVQKGPFINGTSISMAELDVSMNQTGKNFTTQITNNNGSFQIDTVKLTSEFVEFSASGFYFDEVKGAVSAAPLNLYALSDIKDISSVNVNIITHLEKLRVDNLIKTKTFAISKKQSQVEILNIFGFTLNNMNSSESLDISVDNESNAILLAISIILQGNRSVGDLSELLANISNDISTDGILNDSTILTSLRTSTIQLDLASIRSNLVQRYNSLGINATIPDFENTGKKPSAESQIGNSNKSGATLYGVVNPNSLKTTITFEYGTSTNYGYSSTPHDTIGSVPLIISAVITGLSSNTTYHFRIKSQNSLGITYSDDKTFITKNFGSTVTDIDGNIYGTVTIGTQVWMSENLKTTKYRNGDPISKVTDNTWGNLTSGAYCWENNDVINNFVYGALYNWYAVNDTVRKIAPLGWHVATADEWTTLTNFLGGDIVAGGKLKESGPTHWGNSNTGTDDVGFTALPGGYRSTIFCYFGAHGYFWTSTNGMYRIIHGDTDVVEDSAPVNPYYGKTTGFSVRCVKD